jgi:hypothetical protein
VRRDQIEPHARVPDGQVCFKSTARTRTPHRSPRARRRGRGLRGPGHIKDRNSGPWSVGSLRSEEPRPRLAAR